MNINYTKANSIKDTIYYLEPGQLNMEFRNIRSFDSTSNIIQTINQYKFNFKNSVRWINKINQFYEYNANKLKAYELYQEWDLVKKNWLNVFKKKYFYDTFNNVIKEDYYEWKKNIKKWQLINQRTNIYNLSNNCLSTLLNPNSAIELLNRITNCKSCFYKT